MQALRQLGGGVILAIISIILVVGGISLALAESAPPVIVETPTQIPSATFQLFPTFPPTFPPTSLITLTITEAPTNTATPTLAIAPTLPAVQPATCTIPAGWIQVIVGSNDTIYSLAQRYRTTESAIVNGNCLSSANLQPGNAIYVPLVVPTVVVLPCSPPATWVRTHIVQPGDNLFRIALSYGLTYPQLQQGNCMGSSTTIYAGQRLWVPNIPTRTPIPPIPGVTNTLAIPTASATASFTSVPPTFTPQPSATSTFIVTASPFPTASNTPVPPPTFTPSVTPFQSP